MAPIKVTDGTGGPARVFAILPKGRGPTWSEFSIGAGVPRGCCPTPTVTLDVELISNDRVPAIEVVRNGEIARRIELPSPAGNKVEPTF